MKYIHLNQLWPMAMSMFLISLPHETTAQNTTNDKAPVDSLSVLMDEITVTASNTEHKTDRNAYFVTEKMRKQAANAQDLADQLPNVRYDKLSGDFKVGNEKGVLLLVDGVQQNEVYIKNLPPERISKIEVITEPTGRFLSEGYAAILNFILKKDYSGYDIRVSNFSIANPGGNNGDDWLVNEQPGAGITFTKDKVNFFANYTYARVRWNDPVWKQQTYEGLMQMTSEKVNTDHPNSLYKYQANYVSSGLNYQLAPKHSLSVQLDYAFQKYHTDEAFENKATYLPGNETDNVSTSTFNRTRDNDYVATLFYEGELGKKWKLYSDFTYNYYSNDIRNEFAQNPDYRRANVYSENKHYTKFNLEGTYSFSPRFSLNAGYANVWRKYNSETVTGDKLLDYKEQRNKLFAYLNYNHDEKLNMKLGMGLEYIRMDGGDKDHFWSLQPYFQLNYKANKTLDINLSYLTNMYYPSLYQLSPMSTDIDSLMQQAGNPALKSAVRHSLTASFTLWDRLTIKPMFKFTPDRISEIYTYKDNKYASTFENINVKQYVLQAIYDQPLGKYFSLSTSFACFHARASYQHIKNSFNGWIWDSEINYFNPRWNAGMQLGYYRDMEKSIQLQGHQMINMDYWLITVQKQFWGKRASLMISYVPPVTLGMRKNQEKEISTSFYSENRTTSLKPYQHMLIVRFNLRFNSGKVNVLKKQSTTETEERAKRAGGF